MCSAVGRTTDTFKLKGFDDTLEIFHAGDPEISDDSGDNIASIESNEDLLPTPRYRVPATPDHSASQYRACTK